MNFEATIQKAAFALLVWGFLSLFYIIGRAIVRSHDREHDPRSLKPYLLALILPFFFGVGSLLMNLDTDAAILIALVVPALAGAFNARR